MVVSLWPSCWGFLLEGLSMRMPVLVFLRLLICAAHMNFSKLFIFLTQPYGAVTCLSWSILEKCKIYTGLLLVCIHERRSSNNACFLLFLLLGGLCWCNSAQLSSWVLFSSTSEQRDNKHNWAKMWRCVHRDAQRQPPLVCSWWGNWTRSLKGPGKMGSWSSLKCHN